MYKTIDHFFPKFLNWLRDIKDPRNEKKITYEKENLLFIGILLFLCKLTSRRQINYDFKTDQFLDNLNQLAGTEQEELAHGDTLAYLLEKLEPVELERLIKKMICRLIRMKCLERYRLLGQYYLIAVDGTGCLTFKEKHCEQCLTATTDGKTIYYHKVLAAKLVCGNGLALSLATEFIENTDPQDSKQDCELRACYRLMEKLKKDFPQLQICLLMDSLYAAIPVFSRCKKYGWKYLITFKEGSMPEVYKEYESLKKQNPQNHFRHHLEVLEQEFYWVDDVLHYKEDNCGVVNVLECRESKQKDVRRFVWLTNLEIKESNCREIAQGGKNRLENRK